jgi:hypothetical protein
MGQLRATILSCLLIYNLSGMGDKKVDNNHLKPQIDKIFINKNPVFTDKFYSILKLYA